MFEAASEYSVLIQVPSTLLGTIHPNEWGGEIKTAVSYSLTLIWASKPGM